MTHSSDLYIAVEGIDGTGKTHVATAISKEFNIKIIKEPSDGDIGNLINQKSWDSRTDFFLFFADRIEQLNQIKGNVVSDRSLYSTFAYQGVELSKLFGNIDSFYDFFKNLTKLLPRTPSHVLLLHGKPELALERIRKEREFSRFEKLEYLRNVQENYFYLSRKEKNFILVDADVPLNDLIEKSLKIVRGLLQ